MDIKGFIMLDRKNIGRISKPHTVEVEKGRLKFFAKAIGETNPIYTDESAARAAGYRSLPAPPTFIFSLDDGITPVGRIEFTVDILQVIFDGFRGDVQLVGDLFIAQSLSKQQ